jgi:hypothetical protein
LADDPSFDLPWSDSRETPDRLSSTGHEPRTFRTRVGGEGGKSRGLSIRSRDPRLPKCRRKRAGRQVVERRRGSPHWITRPIVKLAAGVGVDTHPGYNSSRRRQENGLFAMRACIRSPRPVMSRPPTQEPDGSGSIGFTLVVPAPRSLRISSSKAGSGRDPRAHAAPPRDGADDDLSQRDLRRLSRRGSSSPRRRRSAPTPGVSSARDACVSGGAFPPHLWFVTLIGSCPSEASKAGQLYGMKTIIHQPSSRRAAPREPSRIHSPVCRPRLGILLRHRRAEGFRASASHPLSPHLQSSNGFQGGDSDPFDRPKLPWKASGNPAPPFDS